MNTVNKDFIEKIGYNYPDVLVFTGNLAYDNGIPHCYYLQDLFLARFDELFTSISKVLPFIVIPA